MDISRLPEPLRRRAEELERRPTLEKVRDFLGGFVNDMESLDEIRAGLRQVAASGTFGLTRELRALDEFLAEPQPAGLLSKLVAWDANWVLDDPSDEAAGAFLRQLAEMLRDVLAEAQQRRRGDKASRGAVARGLRELIVVRHGESTANAAFARAEADGLMDAGIDGRDADVPLSEVGRGQAAGLGRWLATLPDGAFPEVAVCSPYLRAGQTLRIAFDQVRAAGRAVPEVEVDDRLRDRGTGELELLTRAAIDVRFPAEAARRVAAGEFGYRPPGGESMMDVADRLRGFFGDASARYADRRVLVVAHDAVVLMLRAVVEGLSIPDLQRIVAAGPVRNGSVTRWVRDAGGLRLAEYNVVPAAVAAGPGVAAMTDDDWILAALRPHGFTPEDERDYEIAVDRISSVIGIYSARLHKVRDDPTAAAPLRAEISRWVQRRKQLSLGDRERAEELRRECNAIIRQARGGPAPGRP